jgi:hypothetical protein
MAKNGRLRVPRSGSSASVAVPRCGPKAWGTEAPVGVTAPPTMSMRDSAASESYEEGLGFDADATEQMMEELEMKEEELRIAAEFGQTLLERTEELQTANETMEREKEALAALAQEHEHRLQALADNSQQVRAGGAIARRENLGRGGILGWCEAAKLVG